MLSHYLHTESSAQIQCLIFHIFLVGILISILNPVPNSNALYFIHILSGHSYLHTKSGAQYFIYILSGHSYLHTESSAWFQCQIFHIFLVGILISILHPVPNISYTFLVGIRISILDPVPDMAYILSGHSYLHTESSGQYFISILLICGQ